MFKCSNKLVVLCICLSLIFVGCFMVRKAKIILKPPLKLKYEPPVAEILKPKLRCHDRELIFEKLQKGSFWSMQNLIVGTRSNNVGCAETITLTTNGDYAFFENLPMLIKSWLAPLSFALFAPGFDLEKTMESIQYARNCLPEKWLIQQYASFHIFFPNTHMPQRVPLSREEALLWPYNCSAPAPYLNVDRTTMYKTIANLTYPINVARNIARKAVNTYFIFANDIELIPSPRTPQLFLELVARNMSLIEGNNGLRVFVMPVFEIASKVTVPTTKNELKAMLKAKTAIPFHSYVCKTCHLVPNQAEWLNTTETDGLTVTAIGKREGKFKYWEPFYISNNMEPIFDERVTWEGQSNKRIQNFAMCLLDYEYLVIHPSFLTHAPGIKKFDKNAPRRKYVSPTNKLIHKSIEPEYRILYGNNKRCVT